MQKLVLVDEFDREYKRLQRPVAAAARANRSLALSKTLRDTTLADDLKVRQYIAELHRYLNADSTPTESVGQINWVSEPAPTTPLQSPTQPPNLQLEATASSLSSTRLVRKRKKGKKKAAAAAAAQPPVLSRLQWSPYGPGPSRR